MAHALTTRPEAFETFAANSPSLWWNDFEVIRRMDGMREVLQSRNATPQVLVGVDGLGQDVPETLPPGLDPKEIADYIRRCRIVDAAGEFAAGLQTAGLANVQTVVFADETHGSVVPAAVGRAVTFALGARR